MSIEIPVAVPAALDTPLYVALIGDIVASRRLHPEHRRQLQQTFRELLRTLNLTFADVLLADFTITSGDEFEGLLPAFFAGPVIPDLIWQLEEAFSDLALRFSMPRLALRIGIGLGTIDTEIVRDANSVDGPAFHKAREAIQLAAKKKRLGGVFRGFGEDGDAVLNGIARVLHHQRLRWSSQQRRLAGLLHRHVRKAEAADQLDLTRQAVSAYARAAGWDAYVEGEAAWRQALEAFTAKPAMKRQPPSATTDV